MTKAYVLRDDEIRVRLSPAAPGGRTPTERVPLLLRESDTLRVDYGAVTVGEFYESNSGGFGVVSRTLTVERDGRPIVTFDVNAPVSALVRRYGMVGDHVELELTFTYAPVFYWRVGYRILFGR